MTSYKKVIELGECVNRGGCVDNGTGIIDLRDFGEEVVDIWMEDEVEEEKRGKYNVTCEVAYKQKTRWDTLLEDFYYDNHYMKKNTLN